MEGPFVFSLWTDAQQASRCRADLCPMWLSLSVLSSCRASALPRAATTPGAYRALLVEPAPYQVNLPVGWGLQLADPLNRAGRDDFSTLRLGYSNER